MKKYNFETNEWSQKDYDNWQFINEAKGNYKTADLREEFAEIIPYLSNRRVAIDIGARFGCYTRAVQVSGFQHIHAFEMDSNFITSFAKNIVLSNVSFYNFPVYSHETNMTVHGKFILNPISGETTAYAIDQFMFEDVDFIRIDCDGPDRLVLQGCLETIKRCKPVIHIEGGNLQIQRDNYVNKPLDIFQSVLDLNIGYDVVIGTGHNPMHILFPKT